jgi:hypothetical protein
MPGHREGPRRAAAGLRTLSITIRKVACGGQVTLAKLEAFLRKAAARTLDVLEAAIAAALDAFAPDEGANYFTASGCEPE